MWKRLALALGYCFREHDLQELMADVRNKISTKFKFQPSAVPAHLNANKTKRTVEEVKAQYRSHYAGLLHNLPEEQ